MHEDVNGRPARGVGDLAGRLADVRRRIEEAALRSGRSPSDIRLVAVTKTHGADRMREAQVCGLADVGENYVQEAVRKADELGEHAGRLTWHLIGPLQTNKVGAALGLFKWIHSVDRLKLLDMISSRLDKTPSQNVLQTLNGPLRREAIFPVAEPSGSARRSDVRLLIQVNLESESETSARHGFRRGDVPVALKRAGELGIHVRGLMTLPPFFDDPERTRPFYRALRELRDELAGESFGASVRLEELSMGMSNDFETAVEEGATMVRVGTALFGPRGTPGHLHAKSQISNLKFQIPPEGGGA